MGIIQCGLFTGNTTVNIGWEPQWIMIKRTDASGDWIVIDSIRGCSVGGIDAVLKPNLNNAESTANDYIDFTATGFISKNLTGTYIYTVIRRPNKPPTIGTDAFHAYTGNTTNPTTIPSGFSPDLVISKGGRATASNFFVQDRLRGSDNSTGQRVLATDSTTAEVASSGRTDLTTVSNAYRYQSAITSLLCLAFKRAPGFLDIVCDTGTGAVHTVAHGLGVLPELIIRKARTGNTGWIVWHKANSASEKMILNSTESKSTDATLWNSMLPTSFVFTVGASANTNASGVSFVTYLFATLPGISKVGSYSGNGGTQTIPCGFTTGSRFILIKRIDNTGDWFVWDTARGITPTTDPHLSLNTTAAEVTTDDSIDQDASGFVINQNAATNINALGGNYLFLAIA